jgi:uroporphyrinogen III methyltransferase / synthase
MDSGEHQGRVFLVGAGPGDPGLLTARALALIARADVILYDRLIPAEALEGARHDAELLFVGKEGGGPSVPQEETESLMVQRASAGKTVVRLKGGDPFVFGRGGEEALVLAAAGIPFEVVPGVTSGIAAAAYAGIPVTHRGRSIAVALITGHEDPGKDEMSLDWQALAAFPGTLVFYMGIRQLPHITQSLIACGRPASEPAAVVERGTLPSQRTVTGTLRSIAELARLRDVRPPSITVVGAVAALSEKLAWLAPQPLSGFSVAVTRARPQASDLARRLRELGAEVLQAPVVKTRELEQPPIDPTGYDLVCLMSPNAVERFFQSLTQGGRDARSLAQTRVAAIGPGTARSLGEHGITADLVPERFVAEGLIEALAGIPVHRALIACARGGRRTLADALRAQDAQVDVVELYETVAEPLGEGALEAARNADYITFTSSSTVSFFMQAAGGGLSPTTRIVSIGPATSQTLSEHGLHHHLQASRHDIDGLIEALVHDAQSREK